MAISFKWSVSKLRVIPQLNDKTNVVSVVEWFAQGTDDVNNINSAIAGIRSFVCGDSFVAYDQLTEQQVLDWCFAPEVVTTTDKDGVSQSTTKQLKNDIEAKITVQIANQLAQKAAEPALPWAI